MSPIEKMAVRLLNKFELSPPFNLEELVNNYADIEYHSFPISADGLTIGIGSVNKPQILINLDAPETRRRFTLAHELGHVIIPWHIGTIISHLEPSSTNYEYRVMEQEANSFAAELLLPTSWLLELESSMSSFSRFINQVINDSGVSRDAALIKSFNTLTSPIICCQLDADGMVIKRYSTPSAPPCVGIGSLNLNLSNPFTDHHQYESFTLGDRNYKSWIFNSISITETDSRPWRDIIKEITTETSNVELIQSINAIMANSFQRNKNKSKPEICSLVCRAFEGRGDLERVIKHPLFPQYILKRVDELMSKHNP